MTRDWIIWGSELSPFTLKVICLYQQAGIAHRLLPTQGSWSEALTFSWRRERLIRGWLPLTAPKMDDADEFPLVPFLFGPKGENLYDSSAIADWLDRDRPASTRFVPNDPAAAFLVRLIDEFADEWGLYLAHHNRWVVSAKDNNAGQRLAYEFRKLLGPLHPLMASQFAARQTRRLPYLFSVADKTKHIAGLSKKRQPPSREGFPPTHALLDDAFSRLIDILDSLLQQQAFLLGSGFTLADASVYGELAMNMDDPSAERLMREKAPTLHRWLTQLRNTEPAETGNTDAPIQYERLKPLVNEMCRTFMPLMRQNYQAYSQAREQQHTCFNEAAFDSHQGLYDGEIDGRAFRSVIKSFQAKVWRQLCEQWQALSPTSQEQLSMAGLHTELFILN
jgi:glutathione S-transferase